MQTQALGWRGGYSAVHAPEAKAALQREPWSFGRQMLAWGALAVAYVLLATQTGDWFPTEQSSGATLIDAATLLFPHVAGAARVAPLRSPRSVTGRPDIQSFGFDLGGSTCACTLQWDREQYWQRVLYGQKYVCGHVLTPFLGYLVLQRWQWVLLAKLFNEIAEEIAMPVFGKWAGGDKIESVETRYDSLLNDVLLTGVPCVCLGIHLVYVLDIPDLFEAALMPDVASAKKVCLSLFQWWVINNYYAVVKKFGAERVIVGGAAIEVGRLVACIVCGGLFFVWWEMQARSRATFAGVALCLSVLCVPFILVQADKPRHEQLQAFLALALAGAGVSAYHYFYTDKDRRVLAVAAVPYLAGLATFYAFEVSGSPPVAAPTDLFYFHSGWCGITDGPGACSSIKVDT